MPHAPNGLADSLSLSLHTARDLGHAGGHAAADATAKRGGYGTFSNKLRVQAQTSCDKKAAQEANRAEDVKELKRKRAEEDPEYHETERKWRKELAKQKERFACKASWPISGAKLTCPVCGERVKVSSQCVEAWECHVKCGGQRANGV